MKMDNITKSCHHMYQFCQHLSHSSSAGFANICLVPQVLVLPTSVSFLKCWFCQHLSRSSSAGFANICLVPQVLVLPTSVSFLKCWFCQHLSRSSSAAIRCCNWGSLHILVLIVTLFFWLGNNCTSIRFTKRCCSLFIRDKIVYQCYPSMGLTEFSGCLLRISM